MIQKWKNLLSTPIGHALISKREDDAYIAAFPRSGSTWLRTMLVNALEIDARSNPDVFNAKIPAVSVRNAKPINALASPRLIMTHSVYRPSIKKAIYLVRDGRDAFISSYHYHVTRGGSELSLEDYLQRYHNKYYGHTWEQHVESWFIRQSSVSNTDLLVVKFEELKRDTDKQLKNVITFLGLNVGSDRIHQAVNDASLINARKIEQQRQGAIDDNNASFYRGGRSQQWQEKEYSKVIGKFTSKADKALKLAGYVD